VLPPSAHATRLDVLEGTSQSIGDLVFSFTSIEQVGGINLHDVDLALVSDALGVGFDVSPAVAGALAAPGGAIRDLKLEFTVTSTLGIDAAGNHLSATATGVDSSASVSELIGEAPAVDLGVFVAWFGSLPDTDQSLGGTFHSLTITKNLVIASGGDGSASIEGLAQRFQVVPEPATAGLLLAGIAGLACAGRRRFHADPVTARPRSIGSGN
jgi:hypothetical protein